MSAPFKMKGFSGFQNSPMTKKLPTYREAWANMSDAEKAKHGSYEVFKQAAIEYNKPKGRLVGAHMRPKKEDTASE